MDSPRFEDLVEQHREAVHTYAFYRVEPWLRQKEPVSDIVQSTLREVLANPGHFTYRGPEAFRAFLLRALEHKLANKRRYWKTRMRDGEAEPISQVDPVKSADSPTPSEELITREAKERLRAAIDELSDEDRRLLTMRRIAELSPDAIASEVGLSASTVRHHLGRIMTHLAYRLGAPPAEGGAAGESRPPD